MDEYKVGDECELLVDCIFGKIGDRVTITEIEWHCVQISFDGDKIGYTGTRDFDEKFKKAGPKPY